MPMDKKRVLFISGSIGLGHAVRDVAIARALRARDSSVEISWLAGDPARHIITEAGENLLPESNAFGKETEAAEEVSDGFTLNLTHYVWRARPHWAQNLDTFKRVVSSYQFDLVVGDETYEIAAALRKQPGLKSGPFVMIYDFVGLDCPSWKPWERYLAHRVNSSWCGGRKGHPPAEDLVLLIGELDDVPDRSFGFRLPNRRDYAARHYKPVGYVLGFDPAALTDRSRIRASLGYDGRPLIVCSIGGTAVGSELLNLCSRSYVHMRKHIGDLQMVLVCGRRLDPATIQAPPGVEVCGYVPYLFKHFAVCDLAIVQGGGTTMHELTALRRPFIYFPLEGDTEQEIMVAGQAARRRAGEKRRFSATTPPELAETAVRLMTDEPAWRPIPVDGAERAAALIGGLLD